MSRAALRPAVLSRAFAAMGSRFAYHVLPRSGQEQPAARALAQAESWTRRVERSLSRFRPDSDLSRLNNAPERLSIVPDLLGAVLQAAILAAERTEGVFDPTVLTALERAGYDRTFAAISWDNAPQGQAPAAATPGLASWRRVRLTRLASGEWLVDRPPGTRLDLGGIGKGWTADQVAVRLASHGFAAADCGGDIRVAGDVPAAAVAGWPVAVENPFGDGAQWAGRLHQGAIATSSTLGRRWRQGATDRHHIIDPRTGLPANGVFHTVTVAAPTAAEAEVAAKACLVLGPAAMRELTGARGRRWLAWADSEMPVWQGEGEGLEIG